MPKFSLSACTTPARTEKRLVSDAVSQPSTGVPAKTLAIPRVSDLTMSAPLPKPQRQSTRLPPSAPVVVTIYQVTERAADVWLLYEGTDQVSLWQLQMKHEERPLVA